MVKLSSEIENIHQQAAVRFEANPGKCFQRHIREIHQELSKRQKIESLEGARVEWISNESACQLILKYEWLRSMATGTRACYGLKMNDEILGAACFSQGMSPESREICGKEYTDKAVFLARGACVPWAPRGSASFLIRWACKLAYRDRGWQIFMAYSDVTAGEIGTVYQACGWYYLGSGVGRKGSKYHYDFISPEGTRLTSYMISRKDKRLKHMLKLGLDIHKPFRTQLREDLGWKVVRVANKGKYVWFEGPDRDKLKSLCEARYPFQPYPKRG